MTQNANGISLKKSKRFTELNGVKFPNLPSADKLVEGELAINYAEGLETISTKNESGNVVTFSSDDYYSEKKLGSGFTGANSAKTVTEAIEEIQPNVNADWDETDETSPAFILNKPFGDECECVVVGFNGTVTLSTQAMPSGYAGAQFDAGVGGFVAGRTYRVTLDGDEFITTAVTFAGTYTGLNMEAGAESPFTDTWSMYNVGTTMFTLNGGTQGQEVSIKVEELTCTTKLIDNKYINSSWEKGTSANSVKLIGNGGTASGEFSVSEGYQTTASGSGSHAEGGLTEANGTYSHAEGWTTFANSSYSHTEGAFTQTNKNYSHAEGYSTSTRNEYEHASGRYNNSVSASTTFGDSGNTLFSVGNGTSGGARHNAFEIRQNGDIYIVNKDGQDVKLQDEIGNITVDQVIDSGTSASTNAVATKAVYDVIVDNEMVWANAFAVLSGAVSSHTENATIHVTASDKTNWNGKLDASAIADFFDDAKYENSGSTKVINFYHGNTIKATIDCTDFLVDGMIDDVKIENGYLVIDFNTASGKQDISIPLTDIFDPSNYYTKSETSGATEIATALAQKLTISDFNTYSGTVNTTINSKASQSDLNTLSGTVTGHTANTGIHLTSTQKENIDSLETNIDAISGITSTDITNWGNAATNSHTHSNKTALDSITGNVGTMAYEATTSYSSATEVNTALGNKLGTSEFNTYSGAVDTAIGSKAAQSDLNSLSGTVTSHTADNSIHLSSTEKTNLDSLAANIAAISGITSTKVGNWDTAATNTHSHSNTAALNSITGNVGTMAYENKTSYSSATQVNTALSGKSDTGHTHDDRYYTESELTGSSTTVVVAKAASATTAATAAVANSVALSNVSGADDIKAIEALTGTSGLLKKTAANTWALDTTSYSSATQVNTALSGKSNTGHTHDASGVTAMTGYQIASSSASVLTTDSLLQTIGKLEKRILILEAALGGMTLVKLTSQQYADLTVKDPNTMYIIND